MRAAPTEIETSYGRLRGAERRGVRAFQGVPYARPPVGALRLLPPVAHEPWAGVRPATRFGRAAPQLAGAGTIGHAARLVGSGIGEDCLYLNIWTPGEGGDGEDKRPVLVWLHGGGFFVGAGSRFLYSGEGLARRGAVVVTLNYRLGALGFLDLSELQGDGAVTSNLGLLDQIAALRWVRDNIAAFGGDPANVTLFGESAGAMSAGALLPRRTGLFRRAILQSGAASNISTPEDAAEVRHIFLRAVGVPDGDLGKLQALPLKQLLAGQRAVLRHATDLARLPWQPSIDGRLLSRQPLEDVAAGASAGIDLLIGTNRDEWRLFTAGMPTLRRMRRSGLERRVEEVLVRHGIAADETRRVIETYRSVCRQRRPSSYDVWTALRSDEIFHLPATRLAEAHARNHERTFAYRFELPLPALPSSLGACHAAELPLVFGSFSHPVLKPVYLDRPRVKRLAESLQEAWLRFARSGEPAAKGLPEWPVYEPAGRRTMILDAESRVKPDPGETTRKLWSNLEIAGT